MPPIVKKALRNRWFTAGVHAGFWLLLYLAVVNLGGKVPDLRDAEGLSQPAAQPCACRRAGTLVLAGGLA